MNLKSSYLVRKFPYQAREGKNSLLMQPKKNKRRHINGNITSSVQEDEIQIFEVLFSLLPENRMVEIVLGLCSCSGYEVRIL